MSFYYAGFLLVMAMQLGTRRTARMRMYVIGGGLFLMAGLRASSVDHDYLGYLDYYDNVLYKDFRNVEPTFVALAEMAKWTVDSPLALFLVYAALGIGLKLIGIARLSRFPLASMLVYFGGFFLLWEMTQIRAAVAGGFLLLAAHCITERRALAFLGFALLAATFHFAALVFLPLYLIQPDRVRPWIYYALLPVGSALYLANFNLVELADYAPIQLIELKIKSYETYADTDIDNIFNAVFLARCALALLLFTNRARLAARNKHFLVLIKIYFIALFLHLALASIPGISSRLSELLLVVEVILIPMLIHFFKSRATGYVVVVGAALTFLAFSLHYTRLLMPYRLAPQLF